MQPREQKKEVIPDILVQYNSTTKEFFGNWLGNASVKLPQIYPFTYVAKEVEIEKTFQNVQQGKSMETNP